MALTRPKIWDIDTNVEYFKDPITVLHQGATIANVDVGFLMNRANGLVSNVALYWNESGNTFVTAFTGNSGATDSNITVTSYAPITVGTVNASLLGITQSGTGNQYALTMKGAATGDQWAFTIGSTAGQNNITSLNTAGSAYAPFTVNGSTFTIGTNGAGATTSLYIANNGNVVIPTTTTSTSTTTGALVVQGGVGISGNLYIGGNLTVQGTQTFQNTEIVNATEYVATVNATNIYATTIGNVGATHTGNVLTISNSTSTPATITYTPATATGSALLLQGAGTQGGTGYFDFVKVTNQSSGATNTNKSFRLNSTGGLEIINSAYTSNLFTLTDDGNITIPGKATVNALYTTTGIFWSGNNNVISSGGGGSAPAGSTGQVQYNNGGVLGASTLYYWSGNSTITTTSAITAGSIQGTPIGSTTASFGAFTSLSASSFKTTQTTVTLGASAGLVSQGTYAIAIGTYAGYNTQGAYSVVVGPQAGQNTVGQYSVLAGYNAGFNSTSANVVSIGPYAGYQSAATNSVAIGNQAGYYQSASGIVINATGNQLNGNVAGFVVAPVRNDNGNISLQVAYNTTTNEFTYSNTISVASAIIGGNLTVGGNLVVTGTQTFLNTETVTATEYVTTISATNLYAATVGNIGANYVGTGTYLTSLNASNLTTGTVSASLIPTLNQNTTGSAGSAPAGSLTGSTLPAGVTASSLTSVGTITSGTWSGLFGAVSGANLTSLTAGNLSGTIPSGVLGNSTYYIGTTAIALNRGSASQSLTGVSIDGSAGTAGTVTTAAQPNITSVGTLTGITTSGTIKRSAAGVGYLDGQYSSVETSATTGPIYTIGGSYYPTSSSLNTMYGVGYTYTGSAQFAISSTTGAPANHWGMYVCSAGTPRIFLDSDNGTAYVTANKALYADLAENYTADAEYAPGTVVVFGGDKEITVTTTSHDTRVAGVISTNPAYLMNGANAGLPVAFTGRVPCQVQGPVTKGQVLVTSTIAGVAQTIDNSQFLPGCVLGKALESINTNNIETIEVVVGRF